jgi:hypothetical protein
LSNEFYQACRNYGATHIFVPTYPQQANDSGTVLDLITGTSAGLGENGAGPVSIPNKYVTGSKYASFGGDPTDYMDGDNDYVDLGDATFVNEMDSDEGGGKGFSFSFWVDHHDQTLQNVDAWFGTQTTGQATNPVFTVLLTGVSGTTGDVRVIVFDDASNKRDWQTATAQEFSGGVHMIAGVIDWEAQTIVVYFDGVDVGTMNVVASVGTLGDVTGNVLNGYVGGRNKNGALNIPIKCGFGPIVWFGGAILSATQHATLYRLAKMPEMSDSVHKM